MKMQIWNRIKSIDKKYADLIIYASREFRQKIYG